MITYEKRLCVKYFLREILERIIRVLIQHSHLSKMRKKQNCLVDFPLPRELLASRAPEFPISSPFPFFLPRRLHPIKSWYQNLVNVVVSFALIINSGLEEVISTRNPSSTPPPSSPPLTRPSRSTTGNSWQKTRSFKNGPFKNRRVARTRGKESHF